MTSSKSQDSAFRIEPPAFEAARGVASFTYGLDGLSFTETLAFPDDCDAAAAASPAFAHLLDLTAVVLGVSYFKLRAPFDIDASGIALSETERAFVVDLYENGLAEFYARNDLKRFGKLRLFSGKPGEQPIPAPALPGRILLPIGGGKDSLASVQLLERAGRPFIPFAVNPRGPILTSVAAIGKPPLYVTRRLDPEMIRLSKKPGYYNGHVPATAINSMIASLACLLFGHDTIALSNERSASEGNAEFDGREVNHQYSKSLDFEERLARVLAAATGGALGYFSLLRPYSEARIAAIFARETRFDLVFSSCNENFRLAGHDGPLWCGRCPKCLFTFLVLAPHMDKDRLIAIFGRNLLDTPDNEIGYRHLTGLAGQKPWECVGEILEAAACLGRLAARPDWRDDALVRKLAPDLARQYGPTTLAAAWDAFMADSPTHHLPETLAGAMATHAA